MAFICSLKQALEALKFCAAYASVQSWHCNSHTPLQLYLFLTVWLVDRDVQIVQLILKTIRIFIGLKHFVAHFVCYPTNVKVAQLSFFPILVCFYFVGYFVQYIFFSVRQCASPFCSPDNSQHIFEGNETDV